NYGGIFMRRNRRRTSVPTTAKEVELKDDDFVECLSAFIADLKMKQRSEHTIVYYEDKLRLFRRVLEGQRFKTRLRAITGDIITDGYIRHRYDVDGVKHASIASDLRAVRAFLNWAV